MNWRNFSIAAATLLIIPLGTYAAQIDRETNNLDESITTNTNLAQYQVKHGGKYGRGRGISKLLEQLDLTPEQSQQIEVIQERSRSENETLRQQLQTNHQEMRSLFTSESTPEQLRTQYQQIQDARQQLANNRFETMLQIREILTPEQRAQMAELMAQHRGKRGHHRQF